MATRKIIRSKQQYQTALELEKTGDQVGATKLYQKAASSDPLNVQAWNRQMILFRKTKSREDEIALIKTAIEAYSKQTEADQQDWLKDNSEKAESSRELAKVLGLLGENGMPAAEDNILKKWHTRLYLLEYRLKNARKNKPKAAIQKIASTTTKSEKSFGKSGTEKAAAKPLSKPKKTATRPKTKK